MWIMTRKQQGFGLVEVMVAMVLGLLVVLGITQIFVSSKQTYVAQDASARLQEDARYVLARMTQELRMAGMFGCLSLSSGSITGAIPTAFDEPISWDGSTLGIITANAVTGSDTATDADWTLTTDCKSTGAVQAGNQPPDPGQMAFPIRQVEYQYDSDAQTLSVQNGGAGGFQPLITGVAAFDVSFGVAADADSTYASGSYELTPPDSALIRSVRIKITLTDPDGKAGDQTYSVVAALRNRLL